MRPTTPLALFAALCLSACGGGGSSAGVDWTLTGLEPLGSGFVYEGWVITSDGPVSTGRFTVDAMGTPSSTSASLTQAQRDSATAFVLSIEPEPDADPGPSATKFLAGDFGAGTAALTISHPAALGDLFTGATGSFILATPTTAAMGDENQGIWYLDPMAGPGATLMLPTLPAGWAYEGWIAGAGGPVTTGRFTDPAMADSDMAGPTAGGGAAPPFPGQDFIMPPVDLVGRTAVISVEPEPDDSPAPFVFKPLLRSGIAPDIAPVLQPMTNNAAASAPTGTATLR